MYAADRGRGECCEAFVRRVSVAAAASAAFPV